MVFVLNSSSLGEKNAFILMSALNPSSKRILKSCHGSSVVLDDNSLRNFLPAYGKATSFWSAVKFVLFSFNSDAITGINNLARIYFDHSLAEWENHYDIYCYHLVKSANIFGLYRLYDIYNLYPFDIRCKKLLNR